MQSELSKTVEFGQRFGRLEVVEFSGRKKSRAYWKCECDCGNVIEVREDGLKNGHSKSCGCLQRETVSKLATTQKTTHGMSRTSFYNVWAKMKGRCMDETNGAYKYYGGRGIVVSERWLLFENFLEDMHEGYLKHVAEFGKDNTTLERLDNNKGYSKENCKWATNAEQTRNRRSNKLITYKGETLPVVDMAKKYSIPYSLLNARLRNGWDVERAIETPKRGG